MSKWSEVSSCSEINASAPCSVEFALKAKFPDDKQQSYPAKGIPYKAHTPQGVVEGTLDGNGEVIISDTGIGNATIEVHPHVDKKITKLRLEIQTILHQIIQEERAEAAKIAKAYNKESYLGKVGENLKAEGRGLRNIGEGIWGGIKAIGGAIVEVTEQASEYVLDPLNAPETFKEDVKAIKATYHELKQSSEKAIEIYQTLKDDSDSKEMLENFVKEYISAQHSTELLEHAVEMAAGIGLTLLTGGAAAAALGTRFAAAAAKLAPLFEKLSKLLKEKKWFHKKKTVQSNKKAVVTTLHRVKCFKPGAGLKKGFMKRHPTGKTREGRTLDEEFNRQLKNQEEGINKMSPEDLIDGIDNYKGMRDPKKSKKVRQAYKDKIKKKREIELENSGLSPLEIEKHSEEYAENAAKQVAVLHNPDGIAGGKDAFDPKDLDKHIGDKGVNSSLGSQWAREDRTKTLRAQAVEAKANGDKKMNTKLKRCK